MSKTKRTHTDRANEARFGLWLSTPNVPLLEMAFARGFEIFVLDVEHGLFDVAATDAFIALARQMGAQVYAKVGANEPSRLQHMLDRGVAGLIIAHVGDAQHATAVTAPTKYPPAGQRSFDGGRTVSYGAVPADYFTAANEEVLCLPMIETAAALADAERIAALAAVDGLFVGPYDLSLDSGRGAYRRTPADAEALQRVARAALAEGKPCWMPAWTEDEQQRALALGFSTLIIGEEWGMLMDGVARLGEHAAKLGRST